LDGNKLFEGRYFQCLKAHFSHTSSQYCVLQLNISNVLVRQHMTMLKQNCQLSLDGSLGPSIKDVRSQGEGVCLVRTFFGQGGGVLQMHMSALFGANNFGFFEIYGVSARTRRRGGESVRTHFRQKGGGHFFAILCGRPLWTVPFELLNTSAT